MDELRRAGMLINTALLVYMSKGRVEFIYVREIQPYTSNPKTSNFNPQLYTQNHEPKPAPIWGQDRLPTLSNDRIPIFVSHLVWRKY